MIKIPEKPALLLKILEENGYTAHIVGGCVRDSLLGLHPHDWDICTSAMPEEIISCFPNARHIDSGIKHGTVGIVLGSELFEVTTYRTEGKYTDHRHPDSVIFKRELREDLLRRDFTINAMAYSQKSGLVDLFGGKEDLERGVIRCVGDPESRFDEDGLRILRALRFAGRFGFKLERQTENAVFKKRDLLKQIPAERILPELREIMTCKTAGEILNRYNSVLGEVMPAGHAEYAVIDKLPYDFSMRLAMTITLYPDTFDINDTLSRMKLPNCERIEISRFVEYLKKEPPISKYEIRKIISQYGGEFAEKLAILFKARGDEKNKGELYAARLEEILKDERCFRISDLKLGGKELLDMGIPAGPDIGRVLNELLDKVLSGELENEKSVLSEYIRKMCC